jgi:hypothetical protein
VDVEAFVASVDSTVLDYWAEYDAVYPLNDQDMRHWQNARQCVLLWQIYGTLLATNGVKVDPVTANDFLPEHLRYETNDTITDSRALLNQVKASFRL